MNQPIRKIGMQGREAVYSLNGQQGTLHMGFNPTAVYLGTTKDRFGDPVHHFAPTRNQRRAGLHKQTPRQKYGAFKRLQEETVYFVDGEKVKWSEYNVAMFKTPHLCSTKRKVIPHYN